MRRTMTHVFALTATIVVLALVTATPALAHEERKVGKFHFVVGWANEPTYAGYPNAAIVILTDANDKPVLNLGDTLQVDVGFSGQAPTTLSFEPAFEVGEFGTAGDYHANLVPTRPGTYTFRIHGKIRGDSVDETFTCGEKTFDCAKDPAEVQYPVKDPNNSALDTKITREAARLQASANAAADDASNAKIIGYVGVGLGAVALLYSLLPIGKRKASA